MDTDEEIHLDFACFTLKIALRNLNGTKWCHKVEQSKYMHC